MIENYDGGSKMWVGTLEGENSGIELKEDCLTTVNVNQPHREFSLNKFTDDVKDMVVGKFGGGFHGVCM